MIVTRWRIDTQRLILRTATPDDVEAIFRGWASDPTATRYMSWTRHTSLAETKAFLDLCDTQWAAVSVGPCLVALRDTGEPIGGSGLSLTADPAVAEIGYILAPRHWGHGYATETVRALVDWARSLGLRRLHASIHPANTASVNVMRKCGFTPDEHTCAKVRFPNLAQDEATDALSFSLALTIPSP